MERAVGWGVLEEGSSGTHTHVYKHTTWTRLERAVGWRVLEIGWSGMLTGSVHEWGVLEIGSSDMTHEASIR